MIEIWRDIQDWVGFYQVSNIGRIKSLRRIMIRRDGRLHTVPERIMKADGGDYAIVGLSRIKVLYFVYVHVQVAIAFIPNPQNKPEVNHKDGNKRNNHVSNLEWVTTQENIIHAVDTGLNSTAVLNSDIARQIRSELARNPGAVGLQRRMAKRLGVTEQTICDIKKMRSWRR